MNTTDTQVKELAGKITLQSAFIIDGSFSEMVRLGFNVNERAEKMLKAFNKCKVPTLSAVAAIAHLESGKTLAALKL